MIRWLFWVIVWGVRIALGILDATPPVLLLADALVIGVHLWATSSLRRELGAAFGHAPSWTKLLAGALGLALLLAAIDLAHSVQ